VWYLANWSFIVMIIEVQLLIFSRVPVVNRKDFSEHHVLCILGTFHSTPQKSKYTNCFQNVEMSSE